jgi:hypothetical protein
MPWPLTWIAWSATLAAVVGFVASSYATVVGHVWGGFGTAFGTSRPALWLSDLAMIALSACFFWRDRRAWFALMALALGYLVYAVATDGDYLSAPIYLGLLLLPGARRHWRLLPPLPEPF